MALNLATKASQKGIRPFIDDFAETANVLGFCRTLTEELKFGNLPVLTVGDGDDNLFVKNRNLLYWTGFRWPIGPDAKEYVHDRSKSYVAPSAAFVSCSKRLKSNEGLRVLLLVNADTDDARWRPRFSIIDEVSEMEFPVVSWSALANYYGDKIENVNSAISNGKLRLKDYTPDEFVEFNNQERKEVKKKNPKLNPPQLGFTDVYNSWHRPGFCLLQDENKGLCLLTGQDEGSYFVVELPKKVSTIEAALEVLIPEEARVPGVKRQGEWFFVPCSEKEVPALKDTILLFDTYNTCSSCCECIFMPLDDENSNKHLIQTSDGRVGKDGYLYAYKASLMHDHHDEVSMDGWCYLVKNTAITSYSEGGVD